jgi:hypothetical protein
VGTLESPAAENQTDRSLVQGQDNKEMTDESLTIFRFKSFDAGEEPACSLHV